MKAALKEKRAHLKSLLQKKENARSDKSQKADETRRNKVTVSNTSPKVHKWLKDPGAVDIKGIDTKTKTKRRKPAKKKRPCKK